MIQNPEQAFFVVMITAFSLSMGAELVAGRLHAAQRPRRDLLYNVSTFLTQPIISGTAKAS